MFSNMYFCTIIVLVFLHLTAIYAQEAPSPPTPECTNNEVLCKEFDTRFPNYCEDDKYKTFVRDNCQKFCNKCPETVTVPTTAPTCAINNGGCQEFCAELDGGAVQCACRKGFDLQDDGSTCLAEGTNTCQSSQLRRHKAPGCCNEVTGGLTCGDYKGQSGTLSPFNIWPWQILFFLDGYVLCAGALLNKNWVITAGECYNEYTKDSNIDIFAGTRRFDQLDRKRILIRKGKKHVMSGATRAKLALTEIDSAEFSRGVRPICFPGEEEPEPGTICIYTGWGAGSDSSVTKEITMTIKDDESCISAFGDDYKLNKTSMICASASTDAAEACKINSGGPLVCQRRESCQWYLAGIHLTNNGCSGNLFTAVFTDIGFYEDWILGETASVKPHLGDFGDWSACSHSCGGGNRMRSRECVNGKLGDGGCSHIEAVEIERCNTQNCPELKFTEWTPWSKCTETCGPGIQKSTRSCDGKKSALDGCIGLQERTRECNIKECAHLSKFSKWSECTKTCEGGRRVRTRTCVNGIIGDGGCPSDKAFEMEECNMQKCPPVFTAWSPWGECSQTCGNGVQKATRQCEGEKDECIGQLEKTRDCLIKECAAFGKFGEWSPCSATCGSGFRMRGRECINGIIGEDGCPTNQASEVEVCNEGKCPVFTEWSPWSECSVTCGKGTQEAVRECLHGKVGDEGCIGDVEKTRDCMATECAYFGKFSEWTACDKTCGFGFRMRQRECINGEIGDEGCPTHLSAEVEKCNAGKCPEFTEWSPWSDCSQTCGKGVQKSTRSCENGKVGDDGCIGPTEKSQECTIKVCEVNLCLRKWLEDEKCSTLERRRCNDPEAAQTCPNTCCKVLGYIPCIDDPKYQEYCTYYKSYCIGTTQSPTMLAYCKKTCGHCPVEKDDD